MNSIGQTSLDPTDPTIEIGPLRSPVDAEAFRTLNEEWITRHFRLEDKDRQTLGDPHGTILHRGGRILMAWAEGVPVGCVALIPIEPGTYELSKMAVSPALRGRGLGRKLIHAAIGQAREMGVRRLFLGSSTRLPNAVHLYESVGFRHVPPEQLPPMPYVRADVFMELEL